MNKKTKNKMYKIQISCNMRSAVYGMLPPSPGIDTLYVTGTGFIHLFVLSLDLKCIYSYANLLIYGFVHSLTHPSIHF